MKMTVKRSTMVTPMEETPRGRLWLSSLDLLHLPDTPFHSPFFFIYRPNGAANFFDAAALMAALSRALVEFYPFAGRLRKDSDGRLEINCNGQGASFVEADCDGVIDDLGDFSPRPGINLIPAVDYSKGLSSFPLSLIQLTRFKCGGICLGFAMEHHLTDGVSIFDFLLRWCEISRGGAAAVAAATPFLDRRILVARNPPRPQYNNVEHQQPPSLQTPLNNPGTTSYRIFSLTRGQINSLKQTCKSKYTTFEVVTGHAWRCVTAARQLPENQETKLQFATEGRQRFRPPLPAGYCGNVVVYTAAVASCGELLSNPLEFAAEKVHEAITRVDDEYMRSAVDFWEMAQPSRQGRGATATVQPVDVRMQCPNLGITSWLRLPTYKIDFGWGNPIYCGPGSGAPEGRVGFFYHADKLLVVVTLYEQHMEIFEKLLYKISVAPPIMSKV